MREALVRRWRAWIARRIPRAAHVRLDHRRIFIMPTRLGGAFAGVLVLLLLVAINYQNSLAYALTFLLASVAVVAILHTFRNLLGLTLQGLGAQEVYKGQDATFSVRLAGAARGHQALSLGAVGPLSLPFDVPGGEPLIQTLNVPSPRRGWLDAPRLRVETRYPLGLFVAWSWVTLDHQVLVYPAPVAGELPLASGTGEEAGSRLQRRGVEDFQGLRRHQPGDGLRRVSWKAYARERGLLVKDFASEQGGQWALSFDALEGDVEYRLSRLCHAVLRLSERGQGFSLTLPGQRIGMNSGEAHTAACLFALALFGAPND